MRSTASRRIPRSRLLAWAGIAALGILAVASIASNEWRNVLPGLRVAGPLPVSLQNEVDAACDRGRKWLCTRQASDGAWGVSNRIDLTAAAWLTLAADPSPATTSAVTRAWRWLEQQTNIADQAWLRLVRAVQTLDAAGAEQATADLAAAWKTENGTNAAAGDLAWLWIETRSRNRDPAGTNTAALFAPAPADWRAQTARRVVSTQLAAPEQSGAGYWRPADTAPAGWRADAVAQTSFALLILQEL